MIFFFHVFREFWEIIEDYLLLLRYIDWILWAEIGFYFVGSKDYECQKVLCGLVQFVGVVLPLNSWFLATTVSRIFKSANIDADSLLRPLS